ncbi:putative membrane-anchored protein [Paenibacillus cellulosilyticus]|uniref:Putative membrane-anchored protein n=1 Tax=Paenibacillus cellulosilyticus TaxID=375489 RepID=A0A2V2YZN2_9BACL|nr:GDYXXLXY domain-containing protein [Paenibacillus cellulosilyticus]PWW08579.1 putative membrane-anchored protein [Paenibacillus cellulosilyticus]QKS48150.1 GDYXXLXY domain-containing protein [Paenibacillus cellulosilyticus]
MLRLGTVRTGFILGISMILAAIIYFFAANWNGMDRISRTVLAGALVVLLYGASYGVSRIRTMRGHHLFLSAVLLLGGCIAFGASVALLGQIYNSHADSYGLFLIWAIAALLFSLITRYYPFYVLTYILGHIALWQYFYPTNLSPNYSEGTMLLIGAFFALINLVMLVLTEKKLLISAPIRLLSFLICHISLLWMSNSLVFEHYGFLMNIVSIAAIAAAFYYYMRIHLDKIYLTLSALAASAFAVLKFIELLINFASIAFFFYGLVFVVLLLTGNIMFFRRLSKLDVPHESDHHSYTVVEADQVETHPIQPHSKPSHRHRGSLTAIIVSAAITGLSAVIGSASILGLVMMLTDSADPFYIVYAIGIVLVLPMLILPRIEVTVRYTLLAVGFILGIIAAAFIGSFVADIPLVLLSAAGLALLKQPVTRYVMYGLLNLHGYICLYHLFDSQNWPITNVLLVLLAINVLVYIRMQRQATVHGEPRPSPMQIASFFFSLLYMLSLTFFDDRFAYSYALFNVANFVIVTLLLFWLIRKHREMEALISAVFWFIFVGFKYYDLLWSLLHKSITLALLGILLLAVTYWYARRFDAKTAVQTHTVTPSYWKLRPLLLVITVVLQLGFISYQAAASEHALRSGTPVKLEIAPVDPRSMLQGDYVTLSYTNSRPSSLVETDLRNSNAHKVKVVLKLDANGVYQFSRLYSQGESIEPNEVIMNGRWDGWGTVQYGIETYFVPEGTGMDVQREARYAYVRVSSTGNAILERLSDQ